MTGKWIISTARVPAVCVNVCVNVYCGVLWVCLPCDIVERLGVVIHKASTQIEASILFPRERRVRETETKTKKWRKWFSCKESCNKDTWVKRTVHAVVYITFLKNPWSHLVWFSVIHTDTYSEGNIEKILDRVRDFNFQLSVNQPTSDYMTLFKCDWGPGLFLFQFNVLEQTQTQHL